MKSRLTTLALVGLGASSAFGQADRWTRSSGGPLPQVQSSSPKVSDLGGSIGTRGCLFNFEFDRATFVANNPDLCNGETFEESLTLDVGGHNEPLWACTNDVNLMPGDIEGLMTVRSNDSMGLVTLAAGFAGNATVVAGAAFFSSFTVLEFNNEPTAVGFDVLEPLGAGPIDIRAYACDGTHLGTTTFATAFPETFVGITSNFGCPGIFRVEIEGTGSGGELVDNIVFNGHCSPTLGPDATHVSAGSTVNLAISEASDPSRAVLFITSVNGAPFNQLLPGLFTVPGTLCIGPSTVPAGAPPGTSLGLTAFLLDGFGTISATNEMKLIIP